MPDDTPMIRTKRLKVSVRDFFDSAPARKFIGRAPQQVESFVRDVVQPIRSKHAPALNAKSEVVRVRRACAQYPTRTADLPGLAFRGAPTGSEDNGPSFSPTATAI
jgi:hypothetical protein